MCAALTGVAPAPAHAHEGVAVGTAVVLVSSALEGGGGLDLHSVSGSLTARVYPIGGSVLNLVFVEWDCTAVALPTAASTTIDECTFDGQPAALQPVSMPGPAAFTAGAALLPAKPSYEACIAVRAQFIEDVLGPFEERAGTCDEATVAYA